MQNHVSTNLRAAAWGRQADTETLRIFGVPGGTRIPDHLVHEQPQLVLRGVYVFNHVNYLIPR